MPHIELSAGTIEYQDTGGAGPVVLPLHGLLMDASLWRGVVAELGDDYRCIVPTLPLGSHRMPMRHDADISHHGVADLVAELMDKLDLSDVTLVGNDTAIAQLVAIGHPERLGRLVLASCEAFDNVPPGLPGRVALLTAATPGGLYLAANALRFAPLRRLPCTFGWMSKKPVPDEIFDQWMEPCRTNAAVRRDVRKFCKAADRRETEAAAERLRGFDKPALIVWAAEDRVMPTAHGRRLAELLPDVQVTDIQNSYTLIPEDQPAEFAACISEFIGETTERRHTESA